MRQRVWSALAHQKSNRNRGGKAVPSDTGIESPRPALGSGFSDRITRSPNQSVYGWRSPPLREEADPHIEDRLSHSSRRRRPSLKLSTVSSRENCAPGACYFRIII